MDNQKKSSMSLAKKYNRRTPLRNYHRRPVWEQNTYSDEYHFGFNAEPHRFHNMDYEDRNFWPSYHDHEDVVSNDEENYREDEFISNDEGVDRFSRSVPRRRHLRDPYASRGYERWIRNRPNPYYSNEYYYEPSDERYEYEDYGRGGYNYDYYESFPNYGNVGQSERRFRRSDKFPQSGFDKREREQGLRRRGERPSIRDKRY
jgi:hypothetical protein